MSSANLSSALAGDDVAWTWRVGVFIMKALVLLEAVYLLHALLKRFVRRSRTTGEQNAAGITVASGSGSSRLHFAQAVAIKSSSGIRLEDVMKSIRSSDKATELHKMVRQFGGAI